MLYNKCLTTGTFPNSWKSATVVPLHKKANSMDVNDLRSISLFPLPGEILENVVCNRLQSYMYEHELLYANQHGYRKGRSIQSAIGEHLSTIINNIISNKLTFCLYLDYKKAFDTISHLIILKNYQHLDLVK